jgi:hypothetical protein
MEALRRRHRLVVLANDHEHKTWNDFARARGMRLGPFARLVLNNATGAIDPPELDAFTDDDLARYARMTVSEGDLRKLLREERGRPIRRPCLPGSCSPCSSTSPYRSAACSGSGRFERGTARGGSRMPGSPLCSECVFGRPLRGPFGVRSCGPYICGSNIPPPASNSGSGYVTSRCVVRA